jgi:hypothetical protein
LSDCYESSLFGWLVADGWCWFVLREEYCWLVAGGWFVLREKYCWLVADKPSEQGEGQDQPATQLPVLSSPSMLILICGFTAATVWVSSRAGMSHGHVFSSSLHASLTTWTDCTRHG